jgi:hypothetical protein
MTQTKILLLAAQILAAQILAAAVAGLTSPVQAGSYTPRNPWLQPWTCTAYEDAHRCNAIWHPRSAQCRCLGLDDMGWRLNEYYGPGARNLAPRDVEQ